MTPTKFASLACPQTLAAALGPVEARAYQIHQERQENSARNYPWAEPLTFDGGERDFCLSEAKLQLDEEARAEVQNQYADQQYAELFATLSDADIAEALFRINEEISHLPYRALSVNIADRKAGLVDERRRFMAEQKARANPQEPGEASIVEAVARALEVEAAA